MREKLFMVTLLIGLSLVLSAAGDYGYLKIEGNVGKNYSINGESKGWIVPKLIRMKTGEYTLKLEGAKEIQFEILANRTTIVDTKLLANNKKQSLYSGLKPNDKKTYDHFPIYLNLYWDDVPNVAGYIVLIQCSAKKNNQNKFGVYDIYSSHYIMHTYVEKSEFSTKFVGNQGRWCIKAVKSRDEYESYFKLKFNQFHVNLDRYLDGSWSEWRYFRSL